MFKTSMVTTAIALLVGAAPAEAASARTAALQVALRAHGVYAGAVDGVAGPGTAAGLRRLQARRGLVPDGIVGPRTRRALGALGRHPIGSRPLRGGDRGWDVAALQFALETHGFPCGSVDGGFGARTSAAAPRRPPPPACSLPPPPPRTASRAPRPLPRSPARRSSPRCCGARSRQQWA